MSQPQKTYIESKIITRLSIWAPDPGSQNRERANLTFGKKGHNLEILVWPRNPSDKGKPPIRANLNITQIETLCRAFREAAASAEKFMFDIPINYARKVNDPETGKDKTETYLQSTIRIIRNTEGLIGFFLVDPDDSRARILFPLELDRWTGALMRNGVPLSAAEMSSGVAVGYANILETVFRNDVEMVSREQQAERNSGGNPYQPKKTVTKPTDFDDDITF